MLLMRLYFYVSPLQMGRAPTGTCQLSSESVSLFKGRKHVVDDGFYLTHYYPIGLSHET